MSEPQGREWRFYVDDMTCAYEVLESRGGC